MGIAGGKASIRRDHVDGFERHQLKDHVIEIKVEFARVCFNLMLQLG